MRKIILFVCAALVGSLAFSNGLHRFKLNGAYGFFDDGMNVSIKPVYSNAEPFFDGETVVVQERKYRIISEDGSIISLPEGMDYEKLGRIYRLSAHCYRVEEGIRDMYVINTAKKTRVMAGNVKYNFVTSEDSGYFVNYEAYYDDELNSFKLSGNWLKLYPMRSDAALVVDEKHNQFIIDKKSNILVENVYNSDWAFNEGLMPVISNKNSGYINNKGKFVIECLFYTTEYAFPPSVKYGFSEGVAVPMVKNGVYRVYDKTGKILMQDTAFASCSKCKDCLICFKKESGGKFGFMDKFGNVKIEPKFDSAEDFEGGYALVVIEGKDAVVDKAGKVIYSESINAGTAK